MSDQLPSPEQTGLPPAPAPRPTETIVYQPISAWAVGGLVVSGLFTLLVLGSTIVALVQGAPVFFPTWVLSLAVVGIILSFVGQNQVRNSEGTRTGAKLATLGIWLGVVSGLCYLSYFYATRYAQETQANNFLMTEGPDQGFFPLLRQAATKPTALNAAFLLTRPITARSGNPEDPKSMALNNDTPGKDSKGELSAFKESIMPRVLFKKSAEDAEITPQAVQEWKYEKKSYRVSRNYLIKTKEVEMEMVLTVASTEAEASGQGRKWFLNLNESGVVKKSVTRYGKGLQVLRYRAREWFEQKWLAPLNEGQPFHAIKDIDQTPWRQLFLQDQKPEDLKASLYRLFESSKKNRFQGLLKLTTRPDDLGFWDEADGKVRIYLHFQITMLSNAVPATPLREISGQAIVETRQVVHPQEFDESTPAPDWTLAGIVFTNSLPPGMGSGPFGQ